MRKITTDLTGTLKAILNQYPNSIDKMSWSSGNTAITGKMEGAIECLEITLHGHAIAKIYPHNRSLKVDNCGYPSNVTHSRINAVLDAVNLPHIRATKKGTETVFTISSVETQTLAVNSTLLCY